MAMALVMISIHRYGCHQHSTNDMTLRNQIFYHVYVYCFPSF